MSNLTANLSLSIPSFFSTGGEAVQVHAALLLLHHLLCDVASGIHPAARMELVQTAKRVAKVKGTLILNESRVSNKLHRG